MFGDTTKYLTCSKKKTKKRETFHAVSGFRFADLVMLEITFEGKGSHSAILIFELECRFTNLIKFEQKKNETS